MRGSKANLFDPYRILGVSPHASPEEIRKRYRELVKTHHPDVRPDKEKAHEEFLRIQEAYRILSDPKLRERYDRLRRRSEEAARRMVEEARERIEEVERLLLSAEVDLVRGDLPSAARKCQEVLRSQPGNAPAYALLAEVLLRAGREEEAVAALSMAIQYDPENPIYHRRLNEVMARKQGEKVRAEGLALEGGVTWMRWAAVLLAGLWCAILLWLVRLYPGEPILLGIPGNVLGGAAAMGLVEGA
ncbi:MAG TPA: tetratricopeptide repeat protein, partial [Armatimonadetes bacterium]|nr:tetratricopeptide repeat protein [Armatimonadota bacterium]